MLLQNRIDAKEKGEVTKGAAKKAGTLVSIVLPWSSFLIFRNTDCTISMTDETFSQLVRET
jgi:hypothetical protein